jgi:hypothetical protein
MRCLMPPDSRRDVSVGVFLSREPERDSTERQTSGVAMMNPWQRQFIWRADEVKGAPTVGRERGATTRKVADVDCDFGEEVGEKCPGTECPGGEAG